ELLQVRQLWDIFLLNDRAIRLDFELLTHGRRSQPLSASNTVIGEGPVFVEEGAVVEGATLNATDGPIYIGAHAQVMEGALLRGSLAICDHAVIKMGAKVYGGTTIGPWCKVGGEVQNVVFFGYSNKAHDGYLGNSVIGEWCNLGADTNCSNLKNDYGEVKLWSYEKEGFVRTGQQFCGLFLGDHSKCGINTMFNTGTVVGVSANIFGAGYPRNFVPSFAWGGPAGWSTYRFDKAIATAERVMARRKVPLTPEDRLILMKVFEESARFRHWEKGA
ncbi:MAG: glucose-1-phosphate thymidylyltransferase, partial [Bacteroidetes bacterium]